MKIKIVYISPDEVDDTTIFNSSEEFFKDPRGKRYEEFLTDFLTPKKSQVIKKITINTHNPSLILTAPMEDKICFNLTPEIKVLEEIKFNGG